MLICQQSITNVEHTNQIQGDYNMQTKKFILVFTVNGTLRLISYEEAVKLLHEKSRPRDYQDYLTCSLGFSKGWYGHPH